MFTNQEVQDILTALNHFIGVRGNFPKNEEYTRIVMLRDKIRAPEVHSTTVSDFWSHSFFENKPSLKSLQNTQEPDPLVVRNCLLELAFHLAAQGTPVDDFRRLTEGDLFSHPFFKNKPALLSLKKVAEPKPVLVRACLMELICLIKGK
jgi:hypothetical protein